MGERKIEASLVISYLRGGEVGVDPKDLSLNQPELLARCTAYLIEKGAYHRERVCRALVCLINYGPSTYRGVAWSLIQKVPLSHLLHLPSAVEKGRENSRRLRHALVNKIAKSDEKEIIRAYFMKPGGFRRLFSFFFLPRELIDGKKIRNERYLLASKLSGISVKKAMKELGLSPVSLVEEYGISLHMVMEHIKDPGEALELAKKAQPDQFFRHGRWFRDILGDEEYERIALAKMDGLKDPLSFVFIRDHLEETGALTPTLSKRLNERADRVLEDLMRRHKLERIALIVDVSGSMEAAIDITSKLYEAFSRMGGLITDLIAFNDQAFTITLKRLKELKPGGSTSIGSAFVLLSRRLEKGSRPQAIILVSDLDENTPPYLKDSIKLIERYEIPLIVIHCGYRRRLRIDYPHAIIPMDRFHGRLLVDVMREFAGLTAKIIKERELTQLVRERRPLEEEIGEIELPSRPPESYNPGYLVFLLCEG